MKEECTRHRNRWEDASSKDKNQLQGIINWRLMADRIRVCITLKGLLSIKELDCTKACFLKLPNPNY